MNLRQKLAFYLIKAFRWVAMKSVWLILYFKSRTKADIEVQMGLIEADFTFLDSIFGIDTRLKS